MSATVVGIRQPAVAGRFYPAASRALSRLVEQYLDDCRQFEVGNLGATSPRALIAPHAGYVCSGIVAAAAFRPLRFLPNERYIIYIIGPAHWQPVHGVGLSSARSFQTPLGDVPVATDLVQILLDKCTQYRIADEAHAPEHCIEVQLPFLQKTLMDFRIVPLLCDEKADAQQLANDLAPLLAEDPHRLLLVSSDLSHYLPDEQARPQDAALLNAVVAGDDAAAAHGQACGLTPILALMNIAQRLGWRASLVDYRNSGDTCGPSDRVVGYGAVVFMAS